MSQTTLPLNGIRVIDVANELGEIAGRILAELGADVIRVEPHGGAESRAIPPLAPDGTGLYFAYRNANKRSVTIDLETEAGQANLRQLLAGADVIIESGRPGELAELGLAPGALSEEFPRLVVASITPFGQTGPYSGFEATSDTLFAMSGWLAGSGIPEKPPLLAPGTMAYDTAGVVAVFAIECALLQRLRSGRGQHLDISALEALAQCNTWGLPNASAIVNAGMEMPTVRSGTSPMYPSFKTSDGEVRLVILAPRQWHAMWEWMGRPEEFADPSWEDTFTRLQNHDVLNPYFAEHFADMRMEAAAEEAQRRGVVVTPMLSPGEVLANEHYKSRDTFVDLDTTGGAGGRLVDGLFELDGVRAGLLAPWPEPGEHTDEILVGGGKDEIVVEAEAGDAAQLPLAGLRVIDFGHGGVGVEGGRMLAEYGADVIKIETRTYVDFIRMVMGTEMTPSFASSSRSKRSFGVNAKNEEGRSVLLDLIAGADIVIENNSTGTMDAMGVGWDDLRAVNPDLIMVSSQMMGSRGAYGGWVGYGPTIQPIGGLQWLWAFDDGDPPPGSNAIHPDHLAGRLCAIGGLTGVLGLHMGGTGRHVELAQVEALIYTLGDLFLAESLAPGSVRPQGNDSQRGAPWGVFPCGGEEQWCAICVRDDSDWQGLRRAMGDPGWAADAGLEATAGRLAARDEINAAVAQWTSGLTAADVMSTCQAERVPAGAMLTSVDQLSDPHLLHRGFCAEIDQQDAGMLTLEGPAFYGTDMAPADIRQAPRLGEHTREICSEMGMDSDEVERLIEAGALEIYIDPAGEG